LYFPLSKQKHSLLFSSAKEKNEGTEGKVEELEDRSERQPKPCDRKKKHILHNIIIILNKSGKLEAEGKEMKKREKEERGAKNVNAKDSLSGPSKALLTP